MGIESEPAPVAGLALNFSPTDAREPPDLGYDIFGSMSSIFVAKLEASFCAELSAKDRVDPPPEPSGGRLGTAHAGVSASVVAGLGIIQDVSEFC